MAASELRTERIDIRTTPSAKETLRRAASARPS